MSTSQAYRSTPAVGACYWRGYNLMAQNTTSSMNVVQENYLNCNHSPSICMMNFVYTGYQTFAFKAVFLSGVRCEPLITSLRWQRQKQLKKQNPGTTSTLKHMQSHVGFLFLHRTYCALLYFIFIPIAHNWWVIVIRLNAPLDLGISRAELRGSHVARMRM